MSTLGGKPIETISLNFGYVIAEMWNDVFWYEVKKPSNKLGIAYVGPI